MLNTELGNITPDAAECLARASIAETGRLVFAVDDHRPGSTEPWISRLVADFVVATGAREVLETGCYVGATSIWIYDALCRLGGGSYTICDVDAERLETVKYRLRSTPKPVAEVGVNICRGNALEFLRQTDTKFDLAWVDDDHEKKHVKQEIVVLRKRMNPGGLILLHDVYGSCDLQSVVKQFGGHSLDLPRLGPAGGLGIIQT